MPLQSPPLSTSSPANPQRSSGIDAVILLGASCGGSADYAMIAEELGYGPLAMPYPCDVHTIRHQLESLQ